MFDPRIRERVERTSACERASEATHHDDMEARNAAIVEADQAGASLREIARWAGRAPSTVLSVLATAAARAS